jgi:hypothetical protein
MTVRDFIVEGDDQSKSRVEQKDDGTPAEPGISSGLRLGRSLALPKARVANPCHENAMFFYDGRDE